MNLVNELIAVAKKNYEDQVQEAEKHLESVKENLHNQDVADGAMIKYFGTGKVIAEKKEEIRDIELALTEGFITRNNIKNICLNYKLRFLNTKYYKKEVPLAALSDLRRFQEKRKLTDYDMKESLYVIAPASHFALGPRPSNDPILLYKEDFGGNKFSIISKWGNDFSFSRRVLGFFYKYAFLFFGALSVPIAISLGNIIIDDRLSKFMIVIFGISIISWLCFLYMASQRELWDRPFE